MEIWHVLPTGEEHSEETETDPIDFTVRGKCICLPTSEEQPNGNWIIIHNSFDGREGLEWANEILNK